MTATSWRHCPAAPLAEGGEESLGEDAGVSAAALPLVWCAQDAALGRRECSSLDAGASAGVMGSRARTSFWKAATLQSRQNSMTSPGVSHQNSWAARRRA